MPSYFFIIGHRQITEYCTENRIVLQEGGGSVQGGHDYPIGIKYNDMDTFNHSLKPVTVKGFIIIPIRKGKLLCRRCLDSVLIKAQTGSTRPNIFSR